MLKNEMINIREINEILSYIRKSPDCGDQPSMVFGTGLALLKGYRKVVTAPDLDKYIVTVATNAGEITSTFHSSLPSFEYLENLDESSFQPHIVRIFYALTKYGMIIGEIDPEEGVDPGELFNHKYIEKDIRTRFEFVLSSTGISDKATSFINKVLHLEYPNNMGDRFAREYASSSGHDSCPSGLLAHMTKCLQIYSGLKEIYPFLSDEKTNDLMVISLALHDIGKIDEMLDGAYQKYSFMTHRGLGLEHFLCYREEIVSLYDYEFFYMICSVLLQHHEEDGESPRTLYALLVHMIDAVEAQFTIIDTLIMNGSVLTDETGAMIKINGEYINILQ